MFGLLAEVALIAGFVVCILCATFLLLIIQRKLK